jgi:hypothetical protein
MIQLFHSHRQERVFSGAKNPEHAIDFANIAGEAENVVAVLGEARPLRKILSSGVPQERITHRRFRHLDVVLDDMRGRRSDVDPATR